MTAPTLSWTAADGSAQSARWHSESGLAPPRRVEVADDTLSADSAYRLACAGTGMLWRGDFQNARHLLQAMARRVDRKSTKASARAAAKAAAASPAERFHLHRQAQSQRARTLGTLLIALEPDYAIALRRAPDWRAAITEAWGAPTGERCVASLRELLGIVGAHEWRKKGVKVAALGEASGNRIHPHYGVFSPVRGEYIDLVARQALPVDTSLAFDIGTGTGVLAALLARRGVQRVVATENAPRALACARENIERLGLEAMVEVRDADLFPPGRAPLVVCNPPWLPARPSSALEHAIYDDGSRMLRGFLAALKDHLAPGGEGWLLLSDLAERLELRTRTALEGWIADAGLQVLGRSDVRPQHAKAQDANDPLHGARAAEVTSLWRLAAVG
ncbi:MAG: class I SAM-dependent methyltransferase [Burkholderiaceae bacterium]|nr:class I SAM-dependent methyltransferase [Burkholderiaceae bacterium]